MNNNNLSTNIYGFLFFGAISFGMFYIAYGHWEDNATFSMLMVFFGLVSAFYSIGLFFVGIIVNIREKIKSKH